MKWWYLTSSCFVIVYEEKQTYFVYRRRTSLTNSFTTQILHLFLLIIECYIHSILLYIYHCLFNIFVTACNPKADIAFLLDSSGSVGQKNFRLIKNFVYGVVEQMTIGKVDTRVGVVSYSTAARMGFHLDDYLTKYGIENAVSSISYSYGNTNTAAGIKTVRRGIFNPARGDRPDAQNFCKLH